MSRKNTPLKRRVISAISSVALIVTSGFVLVAGFNMVSSVVLAVVILSICAPVIVDGGSILEVISGIVEAFVEGIMIVVDAVASLFSF